MTETPAAGLFGLGGLAITGDEKTFFKQVQPLGYILFARNVDHPDQVRALCQSLKDLHSYDPLILIDQEGGRVQRLRPPHWLDYPAMRRFGALYSTSPDEAVRCLRQNNALLGQDLADLGITVSCAPVMDVPIPTAHDIIGDRAFSHDPSVVRDLARPACDGLLDAGIIPVIKHLPGHGRALSDSHLDLPRISAGLDDLKKTDFLPFRDWDAVPCFAMTAHVVLDAVDPHAPITTSRTGIDEIIRGELGFEGLLMSDDIGMKALSGSFGQRAKACLDAGCDVVLHCSGDMDEMRDVASVLPTLSERAWRNVCDAREFAMERHRQAPPIAYGLGTILNQLPA